MNTLKHIILASSLSLPLSSYAINGEHDIRPKFLTQCDLSLSRDKGIFFKSLYGYKITSSKDENSIINTYITKINPSDISKRCDFFLSFNYGEHGSLFKRYAIYGNNKIYYQIKEHHGIPIENWNIHTIGKTKIILKGEVERGKISTIFPFRISIPKKQKIPNGIYTDLIRITLYSGYGKYSKKLGSINVPLYIEVLNTSGFTINGKTDSQSEILPVNKNGTTRLDNTTPFSFSSNSFYDIIITSDNKGRLINKHNFMNGSPYNFEINGREYLLYKPVYIKNIEPHENVNLNTRIFTTNKVDLGKDFEDIIKINIIAK